VILMTSHGEEKYLSATGKSGADVFLPKGKLRRDLLDVIRQVAGVAALPLPGIQRGRPERRFAARRYSGPERRRSQSRGAGGCSPRTARRGQPAPGTNGQRGTSLSSASTPTVSRPSGSCPSPSRRTGSTR
jgi:hypothetical protein